MNKLYKKYQTFIVLVFLVLFNWAEEIFIGEGYFSKYLHLSEHKILRFSFKAVCMLIIFSIGYFGLSKLSVKWIKLLWIYWYVISFMAVLLRVILDLYLARLFNNNIWDFLVAIYGFSLSPFPYLFLCILYLLFQRKQEI